MQRISQWATECCHNVCYSQICTLASVLLVQESSDLDDRSPALRQHEEPYWGIYSFSNEFTE